MKAQPSPLGPEFVRRIDAYWRAANYLSVGQIYLYDNPLLKKPLTRAHVKPRLLGHWGTTPGLNFVYVHLNRVIKEHDLNVIYITGPGHGGPGLVANAYLEQTYSEVYPHISQDEEGMRRLFKQFSFPGGIPSHVAAETPGSIHEGGELGYALSHAFGAAFDNPDLLVACVVGDGEAETGPLATSWHSNKFLNPARDGAVLPILHLNGYKIAGPTVLGRIPREELAALFQGYGYLPYVVEGDNPMDMLERDTFVVFTSDNGGERYSYNWPLSAGKGTLREGGIRVPAIVRWPGRVPAGRTTDQSTITMDWTATLLAIGGATPDPAYPLDGLDLSPLCRGEPVHFDRTIFWRTSLEDAARRGRWKYLRTDRHESLFDIPRDPSESADLAAYEPETLTSLGAAFREWNAQMLPRPAAVAPRR